MRSGTTKRKPRKVDLNELSDQQTIFVRAYIVDWNGAKAARTARYANPNVASVKLLKNKVIREAIAHEKQKLLERLGIDAGEVLLQLWFALTRSGDDFTDETGKLVTDMNLLSSRAKACIDGIKQTVTTFTDQDGNTTEEIKTELKLVPKGQMIDLAMKHKGLFEANNSQLPNALIAPIPWNDLYGKPLGATDPDDIEVNRLEQPETETL